MIRSGNLRVSAAREISRRRKATEGTVGPLCICAVCIVCAFSRLVLGTRCSILYYSACFGKTWALDALKEARTQNARTGPGPDTEADQQRDTEVTR